ncbi:hypothetical protein JCM10212_007149 [Sporobolomyces blumeae]
MLVREFVDDCLYNPNYGYFSTKVDIFDPDSVATTAGRSAPATSESGNEGSRRTARGTRGEEIRDRPSRRAQVQLAREELMAEGFDFSSFRTTAEFEEEVARRYMAFEGLEEGAGSVGSVGKGPGRQVWHTPTELFKPWYGRALARYLLDTHEKGPDAAGPLIIYEIGAGNGTLMADILDYLASEAPDVYSRTTYRIIEISDRLVGKQKGSVLGRMVEGRRDRGEMSEGEMGKGKAKRRGHEDRVEVISKSIFEWDEVVNEPCFFIAMEVLDNFAHDVVRYTTDTHEPLQCTISVDASGDYNELYAPVTDPLIARYLSLRSQLPSTSPSRPSRAMNPLLSASSVLRKLYATLPFAPNLTRPEFIPTRQLELLEKLRDKFPKSRVVMSDFDRLPDAVEGVNAPVVQTRYQGETVPCTTYLVQPGFFDIFFPTDFRALQEMYTLVMSQRPRPSALAQLRSSTAGAGPGQGTPTVVDHAAFLERWSETDRTKLGDGSNPMIESYLNAKFFFA